MQSPKTMKDVQRLTQQVVALNRFIPKEINKCLPLKWNNKFELNEQCKQSFW